MLVRFEYRARTSESADRKLRTVEPYALFYVERAWYLTGFDRMRQAMRKFRLERMASLTVSAERFITPAILDFRDQTDADRTLVVRALFDSEIAQWVQESRSFFQVESETRPDGLLVTFRIRHEQELVGWLLSWGAHVTILEPDSLRVLLQAEAEAMARRYTG